MSEGWGLGGVAHPGASLLVDALLACILIGQLGDYSDWFLNFIL